MLINFADSIMTQTDYRKVLLFWNMLLTMIVHGCRLSLSICNAVVLLNLLYKKNILVSCLSYIGLELILFHIIH
jgi:hypothetical protein